MKEATLKQLLETMRQENAAGHEETRHVFREEMDETKRVLREESVAAHEETRRVLRQEIEGTKRVLREENAAAHEETRRVLRQEMAKSVDDAKRVLRRENAIEHEKTRDLVNNFAEHFDEALKSAREPLQFLYVSIGKLDEKLDRELADVRSEMRGGFAETQAMIQSVDRRITALEQSRNP